ncbi:DUF2066 domain-containing protein [Pleomorphomonas sp. JP5]|uniref:DUF2066 domain-containing protein n=1 Tax=Pleomorphomonas sp. JP5 TaxID=2942998 RepID=UPI002043C9C6|nr:DUF2066 domain-containing protein [Pleomorphomonas sp. JP5]MCM5557596.1 DUF2066 domain-containing protein [Pleomorphomonas sp. JP5]
MRRIPLFSTVIGLLVALAGPVAAFEPSDIYTSQVVVSGQGEANRLTGFGICLERVLTRVTGDAALAGKPEARAAMARAADYVAAYSYRDRLEGRPIHDEQGTYDRPHNLTCRFKAGPLDGLIADLGGKPWLMRRPVLAVFLDVEKPAARYTVAANNERDLAMRQSFGNASNLIALDVVFPPETAALNLDPAHLDPASPVLKQAAEAAGGDLPLAGRLVWSDADHGWVADWALETGGAVHRWSVRGVSFDDAFRVALKGAARILSGSGEPL